MGGGCCEGVSGEKGREGRTHFRGRLGDHLLPLDDGDPYGLERRCDGFDGCRGSAAREKASVSCWCPHILEVRKTNRGDG